jgi:hypothetical protein
MGWRCETKTDSGGGEKEKEAGEGEKEEGWVAGWMKCGGRAGQGG